MVEYLRRKWVTKQEILEEFQQLKREEAEKEEDGEN